MNFYTIVLLLIVLVVSLELTQANGDSKNVDHSIKGQQHHRETFNLIRLPNRPSNRHNNHPSSSTKAPVSNTEIIPINTDDEDEDDDEEEEEIEPGVNKRVPVPKIATTTTLSRRLYARSERAPEQQNQEDEETIKPNNWWARKDLRLRKLHKKLDPDEQQMMELMYGYTI